VRRIVYHSIVAEILDGLSIKFRQKVESQISLLELHDSGSPLPTSCFAIEDVAPGAVHVQMQIGPNVWMSVFYLKTTEFSALFHAFKSSSKSFEIDEKETDDAQNQLQELYNQEDPESDEIS
jgi:hypothetical protein